MTLLMRDRENLEKGIEQGIQQGIEQERKKIIRKMIYQGFNKEQIMVVCEATEKEIEECEEKKDINSL